MIPQLLLSVSVFSFLFSYSSLQYYFSGDSLHFLSHAVLDKNCLFLICNGLLVFLAKTSGFIRPPSGPDQDDVVRTRISDTLQSALEKYVLEEVAVLHAPTKEEKDETAPESDSSSGEEVSIFIAESSEEELGGDCGLEDREEEEEKNENSEAESNRFWLFDEDEEEDEEDEEEMSTEELNRKVEDFIRRMKEEIIVSEAAEKKMLVVK